MRFHEHRILPDFAVAAWNSRPIHQSLIARAKSTNGIYKINGTDIRAHSLPVPSIPAQHALLKRLSALSEIASKASARARRSRDLGKRVLAAVS
jgi:type I restriction enzyme S subunit